MSLNYSFFFTKRLSSLWCMLSGIKMIFPCWLDVRQVAAPDEAKRNRCEKSRIFETQFTASYLRMWQYLTRRGSPRLAEFSVPCDMVEQVSVTNGEKKRPRNYRDFLHDTVTEASGRTERCLGQGTLSPTGIRTGSFETVRSRIQQVC